MTEEIIIDGVDVSGCSIFNNKTKVCMYSRETCNAICDYGCYARNEIIERLEQENKELSFAIEKCLENVGIECDDEEQALRSLPMLGNAHYKVLVEKEALEQENKELKEKIIELSEEKGHLIVENNTLKESNQSLSILGTDLASANETVRKEFFRADKNKDMWREKAEKYLSALEEISLILDELKQQYDYMTDYSEIKEIQDKINEVLGNKENKNV